MGKKTFIVTSVIMSVFATGAFASGASEGGDVAALRGALDSFDKSKVQCYCVCEFDGKSQLSSGIHMSEALEEVLSGEEKKTVHLSDFFQGFIGVSSGSLLATSLAIGKAPAEVSEVNNSFETSMIMPKIVRSCLGCCSSLGKNKGVANYFELDSENERDENNYDGIKINKKSEAAIHSLIDGKSLKSGLAVLAIKGDTHADKVIAAIKETDKAARKNAVKISFKAILRVAKGLTEDLMTNFAVNEANATKALDIMATIDDGVDKVDDALDKRIFKQATFNESMWDSLKPTPEKPVFVLDLRGKTPSQKGSASSAYKQEIGENLVRVSFKTRIPVEAYPGQGYNNFNGLSKLLKSNIRESMLNKDRSSAQCTKVLSDFLKEVKEAHKATKGKK